MAFKRFDYKGQMINYFNKMSKEIFTTIFTYFDCQTGKWTIAYQR